MNKQSISIQEHVKCSCIEMLRFCCCTLYVVKDGGDAKDVILMCLEKSMYFARFSNLIWFELKLK